MVTIDVSNDRGLKSTTGQNIPFRATRFFCFACRHFGVKTNIDPTFTVTGYSKWKKALEKNKGFSKHAASITHSNAIASWIERDKMNTTVAEILTCSVLEKRRFYMTTVVQCITFLVENEIALRGSWDSENHLEDDEYKAGTKYFVTKQQRLKPYVVLRGKIKTALRITK